MWLFFNNAFLSVVRCHDHAGMLLVRARNRKDLERIAERIGPVNGRLPPIRSTPLADYRFRMKVPGFKLAQVVSAELNGLTYTNFKDSIHKDDYLRKSAYMEVWEVMFSYQTRLYPQGREHPHQLLFGGQVRRLLPDKQARIGDRVRLADGTEAMLVPVNKPERIDTLPRRKPPRDHA